MENKFQTSFIPKKSFDDSGKVKIKSPINVLFLISGFMIVLAIIAAGGVFGYGFVLKKRIAAKSEELSLKEASFPYEAVEEVARVDHKLQAATKLLESHTAISPIFSLLEDSTLRSLRFTKFEFSYFSPTRIAVSMDGQARSFGAVAKQAELFSSATNRQLLKEPIFSDLDVDEKGNVTFSFLASIDPSLIKYTGKNNTSVDTSPIITPPISTATSSGSSTTNTQTQ